MDTGDRVVKAWGGRWARRGQWYTFTIKIWEKNKRLNLPVVEPPNSRKQTKPSFCGQQWRLWPPRKAQDLCSVIIEPRKPLLLIISITIQLDVKFNHWLKQRCWRERGPETSVSSNLSVESDVFKGARSTKYIVAEGVWQVVYVPQEFRLCAKALVWVLPHQSPDSKYRAKVQFYS